MTQVERERPRALHKLRVALLIIFVIAFLGIGALVLLPAKRAHAPTPASAVDPSAEVSRTGVEGRYLLTGTTVWARGVEQMAKGDYSQPFSQLDTFERAKYDAWSTDLECPITSNVVPFQVQKDLLNFNCRPEFLAPASKYFNIFDLANNHTDNQDGEVGMQQTRDNIEKAGQQFFGTFDPADSKNVCEVLELPVRVQKSGGSEEKAGLPVAFCGWHYFYRRPLAGEIDVMDEYANTMPVFAFAEMGVEYRPAADAIQQEIAHSIVDHGPEFLIANNPHWVQNTEVYKNTLIVYSTGNFIFDQDPGETARGGNIDLTLHVKYDDNVAKWLALAPSCKTYHDDCLAQAKAQGLRKVRLQKTYSVVAGTSGYKLVTKRADAATQAAVEERMNWASTVKQLGQQ